MNKDLISVIVPVYNVEEYISECIESIQDQTHNLLEIILVDDGSTDSSGETCDRYAKSDSRIVVIHQKNKGVSSARNSGLKRASGDYIGFVDGDDKIVPSMYEEMLKTIHVHHSQMCVCTKHIFHDRILKNSNIGKNQITNKEAIMELLQMNFPTSLGSGLYERSLVKNLYLNKEIHYWEDFEFQLRVLDRAKLISIYDYPLYYYRQRNESANHQQINDKVMSCLKIAPYVNKFIINNYPEYEAESKELYTGFLQIVIGYLSKSEIVHKKHFKTITKYARKYLLYAIKSRNIRLLMKIYIILCVIDARIFWKVYRTIKSIQTRNRRS
jgi:glycosyltransferase involved in cell wall biosynthesis